MPPLFMYARPEKLRTIALASPASSYAVMSTASEPAVTSPLMSTMAAAPCRRTSNVAVASGIPAPFRAPQGAVFVGVDRQEVGEAGDLEDLAVVRGQAVGPHLDAGRPGAGEQAHDQRDAGRVDVARALEVEDHGLGRLGAGLLPGRLERFLGAAVDVAGEVDNGDPVTPA